MIKLPDEIPKWVYWSLGGAVVVVALVWAYTGGWLAL